MPLSNWSFSSLIIIAITADIRAAGIFLSNVLDRRFKNKKILTCTFWLSYVYITEIFECLLAVFPPPAIRLKMSL